MTTRENIGLLIVGILGCTLILQRCNRPTTVKGPAQVSYQDSGNVIVVQHKDQKTGKVTTQKIYEPDPGSTTITTDAKGNVTVHVRQFGVGTSLGIGIGLSNKARIALDDRFAYFKRFGANTGLGLSLDKNDYQKGHLLDMVDPYLGLSYVPLLKAPNTSLVVSYTVSKHAFVFVKMRF
jgi:hypothetical protein